MDFRGGHHEGVTSARRGRNAFRGGDDGCANGRRHRGYARESAGRHARWVKSRRRAAYACRTARPGSLLDTQTGACVGTPPPPLPPPPPPPPLPPPPPPPPPAWNGDITPYFSVCAGLPGPFGFRQHRRLHLAPGIAAAAHCRQCRVSAQRAPIHAENHAPPLRFVWPGPSVERGDRVSGVGGVTRTRPTTTDLSVLF